MHSRLLTLPRATQLPVVWTNWFRQREDGLYGAIDRFYGHQAAYSCGSQCTNSGDKEHIENPMWIDVDYDKLGPSTVKELAPKTKEEESLHIKSIHLSKVLAWSPLTEPPMERCTY